MKVTKTEENNKIVLKFSGDIDEDSLFPKVSTDPSAEIQLDLKEVTLINSCGIREWIRWINGLEKISSLLFMNCPKTIVDQINAVNGFLPKHAKVESLFIPYYCESCDMSTPELTKVTDLMVDGKLAIKRKKPCERCKNQAELDVVEQMFFSFLRT